MSPPTPAEAGRMHALHDLAVAAQSRADARREALATKPPAEACDYLRAYASTAQGIADRLRASSGYST